MSVPREGGGDNQHTRTRNALGPDRAGHGGKQHRGRKLLGRRKAKDFVPSGPGRPAHASFELREPVGRVNAERLSPESAASKW